MLLIIDNIFNNSKYIQKIAYSFFKKLYLTKMIMQIK
jgi:hypothetical protein